jgi:hypothetical protein
MTLAKITLEPLEVLIVVAIVVLIIIGLVYLRALLRR